MTEPHERPDPDALLRRVQGEEAKQRRGRLKIFLGFAPGVGKTYRMLQVARDLVIEQNTRVLVGVVEDHKRRETAHLVLGLDLLPRRKVEYRGHTLEEFDLDAALARKPGLVLVDELAHTNAPGSRHAKRWQDVEELLAAGIDVFTTMNVQHVESLNDVVTQITQVRVRETVPDSVLDGADTVELVDIAPEELLQRLKEGKVYLPDQAHRAAAHFFQRGNLLALRELALRRTAQHVDEDVREFREAHGIASPWPAGERVMVCVGAAPSSARLIRAAARIAAGLRCPWVASWVEAPVADGDRERLESHLRLAESLGGAVTRLSGPSVADAVLDYARRHNVTRLVIGKPTHSRLVDRLRGSLVEALVRGSGDIDVLVINGDGGDATVSPRAGPQPHAPWAHYASAVGLVAGTVALSALLRATLDPPDLEMLFLLTVMVTAAWFGRGPSTLAAAVGVASYDFFFVRPYFTFSIEDSRYFLTFAMMFVVGLVMSELAARLRRQERAAVSREERTATLYELTRELASTDVPALVAGIAARHAAVSFSATAVVLLREGEGGLKKSGAVPESAGLDAKDEGVAKWCLEHGELAGVGTDTLPGARVLCAPLAIGASRLGVLALQPRGAASLSVDQRDFLDVFCRQISAALERSRLATDATRAELRARTEELRSSLLSAVSHDLRTPLAVVTGAATTLRDDVTLDPATRAQLLDTIADEAERLERLVRNLLDMTRVQAGALRVQKEWVPVDELVGSARTRLSRQLAGREVQLRAELDSLQVDPVLFEQVLFNLLDNAGKYTPPGAPLELSVVRSGAGARVTVDDRGPGVAPADAEHLFDKFFRGAPQGVPGAGLGLAICRGIVEAHGGQIHVEARAGGGARFVIDLPLQGEPPAVPEERDE